LTRPLPIFVALLFVVTALASATSALDGPDASAAGTEPAVVAASEVAPDAPAEPLSPPNAGVVVIPAGGAPLASTPEGDPFIQISEAVVLGFQNREGEWLEVVTTCNDPAWVHESSVLVTPQATPAAPGPGFDLAAATIVLDPGHGDRDWGGVGPTGLAEKHVNLDIAERVRRLMLTPREVDWVTGEVLPGTSVPSFGAVWLTRSQSGPNQGDYELGLGFRAELANAAGADALVSIHNNTVPRISTDIPGTEVYYSVGSSGSDRLAGLIYEELLRSFADYSVDWSGGELLGARARIDPSSGDDYYGLLRRANMPAVIVEGAYISESEEEALLATDAFRQSYAEGVYRGVVRFLTTTDPGTGINAPEPFPDDAGTVAGSGCELPAQS
jgi:N-acetylmuramoyl-L-alanine amidase